MAYTYVRSGWEKSNAIAHPSKREPGYILRRWIDAFYLFPEKRVFVVSMLVATDENVVRICRVAARTKFVLAAGERVSKQIVHEKLEKWKESGVVEETAQ